MSNDNEKKPLSLSRGKLELTKTVGAGKVEQTFPHGRKKEVTVERRKKRSFTPGAEGPSNDKRKDAATASLPTIELPNHPSLAKLTPEERQHRVQVLQLAHRAAEEEARKKVEAEKRAVEAAKLAAEEAEKARIVAEEDARRKAIEDAAAAKAAEEAAARAAVEQAAQAAAAPRPAPAPAAAAPAPRPAAQAGRGPGQGQGAGGPRQGAGGGPRSSNNRPAVPAPKALSRDQGGRDQGNRADQAPRADLAPKEPPVKENTKAVKPADPERKSRLIDDEDERRKGLGAAAKVAAKVAPVKKAVDVKRRGKLSVSSVMEDDEGRRGRSVAAMKRAAQKERRKMQAQFQSPEKVVREVIIPDAITVQELANRMAERAPNVIKALMKMGVMATINQVIDSDTAQLVVEEFNHQAKRVSESDVEVGLETGPDIEGSLRSRAPVVTVMGHVDHGKTSLLDALRETDVVSGEAGGITQHIGAYQVTMSTGAKITFIDTPGHEAFTAMRARGAKVTDIVILVVAADDGIMPQTIEAIRHAKAAEVPIVVAVNKMDKHGADPERVRTELLSHEIVVEQMGGDVQCIEVSAKKRLNLDKLEEAILLQAEILELKANPNRLAEGTIVEAKMEKGRGSVATVLVKRGTLRVGDIFVAGAEWGRVRAMIDDHGNRVEEAGPSMPVEILGLQGVPAAGDDLIVVEDEQKAREVSSYRQRKDREAQAVKSARGTMEQMFAKIQAGEAKELPVVIKGDVQGSIEALIGTLEKCGSDEVKVRVLHGAVGAINESDITLAKASEALVVGFNVRANPQAREMARRDGVDIRYYSIIYDVANDMRAALTGMLSPTYQEKFIGYAEIREVFNITKVGKVAGCRVTEGIIKRGCKVRLLRDNVVVHEGDLGQLKRFKDDVKEVREGFECGMSFANYDNIQVGDVFECFEMEEIAAQL